MERMIDNKECALYGTRYCDLLNMRTCGQCPMTGKSGEVTEESLRKDLDLYESLLPEGGIARLFESKTCQLCRKEPGRRQGYVIFNMAHPEPKRMQNGLLFGKKRSPIGTMVPVQMAVCKQCRRRLLVVDYLPLVLSVVTGALLLALLSVGSLAESLVQVHPVLPFAIWAGGMLLALLIALAIRRGLRKRFEKEMYLNVLQHPVMQRMMEKGWFPVPKQEGVKLVFSKSRMACGLGTAPDAGAKRPAEQKKLAAEEDR